MDQESLDLFDSATGSPATLPGASATQATSTQEATSTQSSPAQTTPTTPEPVASPEPDAAAELPGSEPEVYGAGQLPPEPPPAEEGVIPPFGHFAKTWYLEYAMSVVTQRAIPGIADGEKPVQRRILYGMHQMGLYRSPTHVKSARVVGDVMGKYHPHGDSSIYDAMVRMAQPWSLRYPLVDGQGNFGSPDGDSPAAQRYTEARLTPIAELLLSELDEGTVDFVPNYDGRDLEPSLLPARLPFVLLNGGSGIAVGMATDNPSHNLREVVAAVVLLLDQPDATLDQVLEVLPGPDFPGGAQIISSPAEIRNAYAAGRGSFRARARWHVEPLARGQWRIIVDELPPDVSAKTVIEEVGELSHPTPREKAGKQVFSQEQTQLKAAVLALLDSVKDGSDKRNPIRLVFEPKSSRVSPEELMAFLLAHTSLERNVAINLTLIDLERRPRCLGLLEILRQWIAFRVEAVRRRTEFRLSKAEARIHILEGREAILIDIEKAIRIIRAADDPKQDLIDAFGLSEIQAEDILDIRLRQLARLEGIKIGEELKRLREAADGYRRILGSERVLIKTIRQEVLADGVKYGDPRRTLIEASAKSTAANVNTVVDEAITVIVSRNGWIRARQGHDVDPGTLTFKDGDDLLALYPCRTTGQLALLDTHGRAYSVDTAAIPGGRGDGVPVTTLVSFQDGGKLVAAVAGAVGDALLVASSGGYGFRCKLGDLVGRAKAGKAFLSLEAGERPLMPLFLPPDTLGVLVVGDDQRALALALDDIKPLAKGRGVKLMTLEPKATLARLETVQAEGCASLTARRLESFRGKRGSKGKKLR